MPKRQQAKKYSLKTFDIADLVDEIFSEKVLLKEGDRTQRVTCIRAITHQLWQQSVGGSSKAHKLCMRYCKFAARQVRNPGLVLQVSHKPRTK